jgi:hypothetical protein
MYLTGLADCSWTGMVGDATTKGAAVIIDQAWKAKGGRCCRRRRMGDAEHNAFCLILNGRAVLGFSATSEGISAADGYGMTRFSITIRYPRGSTVNIIYVEETPL